MTLYEAHIAEKRTHFATKADLKALEARLLWAIFSVAGAILTAILAQDHVIGIAWG